LKVSVNEEMSQRGRPFPLNGKRERTQQAYARSVRMLTQFYRKSPDLITEQELQDYFLHRKNAGLKTRITQKLEEKVP